MNRAIGFITLGTVAIALGAHAAGIRPNISESAPSGLWIKRPTASVHTGMLVVACPPDSPIVRKVLSWGDCPNTEAKPLLKAVMAVSGDSVVLRYGYPVKVNGKELPNTVSSPKIPSWPNGEYTVAENQVWIFSTYSNKSFDSRYFGPVDVKNILGEAVPVLVNGKVDDMRKGI